MKSDEYEELLNILTCPDDTQLILRWMGKLIKLRDEAKAAEDAEARRKAAVPQVVPDWKSVRVGTLVKRSEHYLKDRCIQDGDKELTQVGIVVGLKFFDDDLCGFITYPVIHWEGDPDSGINHPMNAAPADGSKLGSKTMNSNQS